MNVGDLFEEKSKTTLNLNEFIKEQSNKEAVVTQSYLVIYDDYMTPKMTKQS